MNWKSKLGSARDLAAKGSRVAKGEANQLKELIGRASLASRDRTLSALDGYWPRVQLLFRDNLKGPATAVLYNDKAMRRLLHLTYLKLPVVVAMAVEEDEFVQFCLDNRHRLLLPADHAPSEPE